LVLRPKTFYSNARDLALLKRFIAAQVPHYVDLRAPTVIITGDRDATVSPQINARALAATLPDAKLVMLKDIGHMPTMPHPTSWQQPSMSLCRQRGIRDDETIFPLPRYVSQRGCSPPQKARSASPCLVGALTFLIVALIAAVLGFGGIAGFAVEIARSFSSWRFCCS